MPLEPQDARLLPLAPNIGRKINSLVRAAHQLTLVGIATTITTTKNNTETNLSYYCGHQNGFDAIFDAIRTIDDVLEYTEQSGQSGIIVTIDFKKAFDSLDHEFPLKVLHTFNFRPSFIQRIRTFYSNVLLRNYGFVTNYFSVDRGMRYGDLLSPLLSTLSPEVMACNIRQNDQLQSIKIRNEEVKFSLFADDMTCFLSPLTDIPVRMFSKFSR